MINKTILNDIGKWFVLLIIATAFYSCNNEPEASGDVIVKVYDKVLRKSDIETLVPQNTKATDSADIVDRYIQEWVNKELILQKAKLNVGTNPSIEKMVEDYRNSLIVSKYMELLVDQKASTEISETEIAEFYNRNPENFKLNEEIINGIFLQIPLDAPRIDDLKSWMKDRTEDDLLELEDYCFQNASKYEDFSEKWLPASVLEKYLPDALNNSALIKGVTIEQSDSLSRYYLVVFDEKDAGETAPLIYVQPQIIKILQHKKRLEYIATFKRDILNDAIENKKVIYYEDK
ncbi:hypothetical protein ACE1ET_18870 [Saccharicrinis sp. FJH62]|uniref:hypothetical protein n=1 Tax=Saccharicrinis sp. FJH62 TaxID=3344657 RepID=UPI0035D45118